MKIRKPRRHYYERELVHKHDTVCPDCNLPRQLIKNLMCRKCLIRRYQKLCIKCDKIKSIVFDFYKKRSVCIDCTPEYVKKQKTQRIRNINQRLQMLQMQANQKG
jgi:hypothetical protein